MTASSGPAGWYPDPDGSGGQRYFDGSSWTGHRAPPWVQANPAYIWPPQPSWKGAHIGRPPQGVGSLASPGRRLAARFLDGLVMLPVFAGLTALAVLLVAPHAGPIFPRVTTNSDASPPTPGIVWIYLAVGVAFVASGLVMVIYETLATARYGRTLGKAWLRIRPVRLDGRGLGWGRSLGRVSIYWGAGFLNWLGLLDPLWCLWDENHQCLHDKVADTIVILDSSPRASSEVSPSVAGGPSAVSTPAQNGPSSEGDALHGWSPNQGPAYWPSSGYWSPAMLMPKTNGLAIASLVCSIGGLLFIGVPSILGVIFGFISRSRIRRCAGTQTGSSLALAGIISGFAVIALWLLLIIVPAAINSNNG